MTGVTVGRGEGGHILQGGCDQLYIDYRLGIAMLTASPLFIYISVLIVLISHQLGPGQIFDGEPSACN